MRDANRLPRTTKSDLPSRVRMHSTEDSRVFDDQTKHLFDFGIAPHASLLAEPNSSRDIDTATTLASLSDEDAENLKFLAEFCSSFLGELGEGFEESERTSSSPGSPIPIATPVPLPYSARSSEVLESMISGPKETITQSLTLAEKLEREHATSPDSFFKVQDEDLSTEHDSIQPAAENPASSQAVFRPIRPVSPSTLIALTEPCLMAWSTRLPLKPLPALLSTTPTRQGARISSASAIHSGCNNWGY
ncbi:hypothetical protein C0995_008638 [Termitomyces sp. Mi166|nr:hypothetical protein C0995_008638 [Termitomyces sp. Mi166\